jgi:hypothetical protein
MFYLLDSPDRGFLEHLQELFLARGLQTLLTEQGSLPDGRPRYVMQGVEALDMAAIRTLLYRDPLFPAYLSAPYREHLLALRQEPLQALHAALISPLAFKMSAFALTLLLFGLLVEHWLS